MCKTDKGRKGVWGCQVALALTGMTSEQTYSNQNGGFPHPNCGEQDWLYKA